ncbi:MAG: CRISPR-associated endoribonuclease Cas6 [Cytophagales bacterium]
MRARVIFSVENVGASIPFHHQFLLSRIVKEMIVLDPVYQGFKSYSFSGVKGQTKVGRDGLQVLSNKITIVFSSHSKEFLHFLIHKIFTYKKIEIATLRVRPDSVEIEEIPTFTENKYKYLCLSPVVFSNPKVNMLDMKKFILPTSDEFSDLVFESTMTAMERSGMYDTQQLSSFYKFQILPDMDYLDKIKQEEKKIARIYNVYMSDVKYEVRGYTIPFTLFAEPQVHQFIFNEGLGALTNEGFGMLDMPVSEFKRGSKPFLFR